MSWQKRLWPSFNKFMSFRDIKLNFFYLRKAFFEYHSGWRYLKNKYFFAKKILRWPEALDKPITTQDLSIHVFTSHRDLIMLLWALASFYRVFPMIGQLFIHSDGTLNLADEAVLKEKLPKARLIQPEEFLSRHLDELGQYPVIKTFRTDYPHFFLLKKLIDPFFVSDRKYRLIIDSDLLWFQEPKELEEAIAKGCPKSLMMGNNSECFVYFKGGESAPAELARFNSGVVLYAKENFSLDKLTVYFEKLDVRDRRNIHFIEQVGYAACLKNPAKLPLEKYSIKNPVTVNTVAKHYTSPRRPLFFIEGLEVLRRQGLL